jgi:hypothetical protein
MKKSEQFALIEKLFVTIPDIWNGFTLMSDDLLHLNVTAEKDHRKHGRVVKGFPVKLAAKYWVVRHLFEACEGVFNGKHLYSIEALLHIRFECLKAQAYVMANNASMQGWYEQVKATQFTTIDYAELMQ